MRKVFVSYSHRLDYASAEDFRRMFSDERDAILDRSIRHDIGELQKETVKNHLRRLIREASVTVALVGSQTSGRWWIDWESYNSSRKRTGNERKGLFGVRIPHKSHWTPDRLSNIIPTMGHIVEWPRNYRTLANEIEATNLKRSNAAELSRALRTRNSAPR